MISTMCSNNLVCTALYLLTIGLGAEALRGSKIETAESGEFPFVASLIRKDSSNPSNEAVVCTGVFVTEKHVVTAEHCLDIVQPKNLQLLVGIENLESTRYDVESSITYDQWNRKPRSYINDIAILMLSKIVQQSNFKPAYITNLNSKQLQGTKGLITGWGLENDSGVLYRIFKKAKVDILSNEQCDKKTKLILNRHDPLPIMFLCTAGSPNALLESGDSGGPFVDKDGVLLGINFGYGPATSWGNFNNTSLDKYRINLHISIDYYRDFIVDVVVTDKIIGLNCQSDRCYVPLNQNAYN